MATVREITAVLDKLFPPENVCMEDSIGLMTGSFDAQTDSVIVCLDCTESVIDEAAAKGAKLVISHHPLIFGSIDRVTDLTPVGRTIIKAIKNGISVYSAHTNMDCSKGGINQFVAKLLGLTDTEPLIKVNEEASLGVVGSLAKKTTLTQLKNFIAEKLDDKSVVCYGKEEEISRVAVINGAGGDIEFIDEAVKKGANCLITAEIKHHVALYAVGQDFNLVEFSHYSSERVFIPRLAEILAEELNKNNLKTIVTAAESESNPML